MNKLIQYLKDIHFFHTWTKWEMIERGEIISNITNKTVSYYRIFSRNCEKCGIFQEDKKINGI